VSTYSTVQLRGRVRGREPVRRLGRRTRALRLRSRSRRSDAGQQLAGILHRPRPALLHRAAGRKGRALRPFVVVQPLRTSMAGLSCKTRCFLRTRAGRIALSFACSAAARQRRRGCDSDVTGLCCGRLLACPSQRSLSRRASPASRRHFTAAATMRCLRRESRPPQHTRTRTAERVCAHPYKRALTLASFRVEPSRSRDGWCVAALHCRLRSLAGTAAGIWRVARIV
jgi:hypothetical protein